MNSYKDTTSLQTRILESNNQLQKHPNFIPVIIESNEDQIRKTIKKRKLLVSRYINVSELIFSIRKQLHGFSSSEALFLFVNDEILTGNTMIGTLYDRIKAEELRNPSSNDMFLYVTLALENTFGTDLDEFNQAVDKANNLKKIYGGKISSNNLLKLYAYYKRVTEGLAKIENKPGFFNFVETQKWNAWNDAGSVSKNKAMNLYVDLVNQLEKSFV